MKLTEKCKEVTAEMYDLRSKLYKMKPVKELVERINNMDSHYEMSDDPRTYSNGAKEEREIKAELKELSEAGRVTIFNSLSDIGKEVWYRYFVSVQLNRN